jgi:hypothetical protein
MTELNITGALEKLSRRRIAAAAGHSSIRSLNRSGLAFL